MVIYVNIYKMITDLFQKLWTIRNDFIQVLCAARENKKDTIFRTSLKLNVVVSAIITYCLFYFGSLRFLAQYSSTLSIGVPLMEIICLSIVLAIVISCKRKQFTTDIKKGTKSISVLNIFISSMKTISFNAVLCLFFYACILILFKPHYPFLLRDVLISAILSTFGGYLILAVDEFTCFIAAVRLYKIQNAL